MIRQKKRDRMSFFFTRCWSKSCLALFLTTALYYSRNAIQIGVIRIPTNNKLLTSSSIFVSGFTTTSSSLKHTDSQAVVLTQRPSPITQYGTVVSQQQISKTRMLQQQQHFNLHNYPGSASSPSISQRKRSTFLLNIPILNEWKVLTNGRVVGTVKDHPSIPNGDIITTSPISRPDQVGESRIIITISGSRYKLGKASSKLDFTMKSKLGLRNGMQASGTAISISELQKRSRVVFDLNRDVVGDDTRQYLLAGKPTKSTSGKSLIYKAYRSDEDGLPQGEAVTIKMSSNWEAIEREANNYAKITKSGFIRGQFTELMDYLPTASVITKKFKNQSALIMERGVTDLKRYIGVNGKLAGAELREAAAAAAQCLQAVHASGLVWTDMKTENFVVTPSGEFKGIDLESAMPVNDNPVDYSPEGTPPEFAKAFLAGDGPYFVLQCSYDVWSLGMLYYEMATGKGYFDGKTPVQITKLLRDGPEIDTRPIEDTTFRNLVAKCLQVDPRKRPNIFQILLHPYFLRSGIGPISFLRK